jgi:hypothetical protein
VVKEVKKINEEGVKFEKKSDKEKVEYKDKLN